MSTKRMGNNAQNPFYDTPEKPPHIHEKTAGVPLRFQQQDFSQILRGTLPERALFTKGTGAYGTFTVTNDITQYTSASIFSSVGKICRIFARFSDFKSEKGSADTNRDSRGFALKFYTEDGIWDLVGSNSPVFFIKEPAKFPEFVKTQQRSPVTNLKNVTEMWNFCCAHPETLHQLLMYFSGRGTPKGFRHMHGYASHTYSMINAENERVWVKYHIKTQQGIKNLVPTQAAQLKSTHPDFAQEDFINALQNEDFPKWTLYIQVMTEEQAKEFRWNPFDVTKVWFHDEFPLIEVGEIELNEIPGNYQLNIEEAAFSPANFVEGLGLSPDPVLQARIATYAEAQQYRLGRHANLLEVNRCPFSAEKDKSEKNSQKVRNFSKFENEDSYPESAYSENEDDHFTQPGLFYTKALQDYDRVELVRNIIEAMNKISGPQRAEIINRQICHFFRANIELGMKIAMGLQINIDANMMNHAGS